MPPKKEPKADGGKKGGADEAEPDDEEKEMLERELVIGHLRNKLGKYIDRTTHLTGEYTRLEDELETQKINLKDINDFLSNELKAKETYCNELEKSLLDLEQTGEAEKAKFESEKTRMLEEFREREHDLQEEIQNYEAKMKELAEFTEQKGALESEMTDLRELLDSERRSHEELIADLERKAVQEKDRLKKEMAQKIKDTKANMMKLTDNQLETTTKRTIMENEQMSSELAYQSHQTEVLLQKNLKLMEENASYRRGLELSKQTEGELAKRNHVYQKTIKTLLAKLKQQDVTLRDEEEELSRQVEYSHNLADRMREMQEELDIRTQEADKLHRKASKSTELMSIYTEQQDEVAKFLITCLQDVKAQIVNVVREQTDEDEEPQVSIEPGKLEELSLEQRERALAYLLEKLHVFQSSKQQRVLGLSHQLDPAVSLPPIASSPVRHQAREVYGDHITPPSPMNKHDLDKLQSTAGTQTADASVVGDSVRMSLAKAASQSNANFLLPGKAVAGDVRPWGRKASSLPLTAKGAQTFLKRPSRSPGH